MANPRSRARTSRDRNTPAISISAAPADLSSSAPRSPSPTKESVSSHDLVDKSDQRSAVVDEGTFLSGSSTFLLPIDAEANSHPAIAPPTTAIMLEAQAAGVNQRVNTIETAQSSVEPVPTSTTEAPMAAAAHSQDTSAIDTNSATKSTIAPPEDGLANASEKLNSQTPAPASSHPSRGASENAESSSDINSENNLNAVTAAEFTPEKDNHSPENETQGSEEGSIDIGNNNSSRNSTASAATSVGSRRSSRRINQDQPTPVTTPARQVGRRSKATSSTSKSLNESGSGRRASASNILKSAVTKDSFEFGELVWALNSGDPMWPARIVDPKDIHPGMRSFFESRKVTEPSYYIFFYGDLTLGRLPVARIFPFKENLASFQGACKRKKFLAGLELILNHPGAAVSMLKTIWENHAISSKIQKIQQAREESSENSDSESDEEEEEDDDEAVVPKAKSRKSTPGPKKRATPAKTIASPPATTSTRRTPKRTPSVSHEEKSRKRRLSSESDEVQITGSRQNGAKRPKKTDTPVVEVSRPSKKSKTAASAEKEVSTPAGRSRKAPKVSGDPKAVFIARMIQEISPRLVALTAPNWAQPGEALRVIRFVLQRLFVSQKEHGFEGPPIADSSLHVIDWNLIKISLDAIKDYAMSKAVDVMALREYRIMRLIRMLHSQKYEPMIEKAMKENEIRSKLAYLFTLFTTYRFRVEEAPAESAPTPTAVEGTNANQNSSASPAAEASAVQSEKNEEVKSEQEKQSNAGDSSVSENEPNNGIKSEKISAESAAEHSASKENTLEAKAVPAVSDAVAMEGEESSRQARPSTPSETTES